MVPIFKNGLRNACDNHRGICLLPVMLEILAAIILHRLCKAHEKKIHKEQTGFISCHVNELNMCLPPTRCLDIARRTVGRKLLHFLTFVGQSCTLELSIRQGSG
ncbi:unnamed protein product [Heterobilharzia americana]|nr:unnamed protein product [Heterobilharzia americana]